MKKVWRLRDQDSASMLASGYEARYMPKTMLKVETMGAMMGWVEIKAFVKSSIWNSARKMPKKPNRPKSAVCDS